VSESRVTWATSLPILVFLGLSVLVIGTMYATDRQTSDVRQTHRLMPPPIRGGDIIRSKIVMLLISDVRHVRRVCTARRHRNDSGRFPDSGGGQYNEVGVSSSVLGSLRYEMQRVSLQQTPAELYTVRLHWRVGDERRTVVQQFVRTGILSTKTLPRSVEILFVISSRRELFRR